MFGEKKKGETQFYQLNIQDAVRIFTAKDCSILAGNGETEFRLRPEKYQGYKGTCHWNATEQIYEGDPLLTTLSEYVDTYGNKVKERYCREMFLWGIGRLAERLGKK